MKLLTILMLLSTSVFATEITTFEIAQVDIPKQSYKDPKVTFFTDYNGDGYARVTFFNKRRPGTCVKQRGQRNANCYKTQVLSEVEGLMIKDEQLVFDNGRDFIVCADIKRGFIGITYLLTGNCYFEAEGFITEDQRPVVDVKFKYIHK